MCGIDIMNSKSTHRQGGASSQAFSEKGVECPALSGLYGGDMRRMLLPRAALRLPWAVLSRPFGAGEEDIGEWGVFERDKTTH
ncbi:hypothetical protein EI77_03960 [Prosthecobacter fusiformis]|uniref:Uncharacterized protein n=1 Tax=Prosthecobacter fusiformis TaxID=48464 RepID=A0A4R7RLJ6_9BACT|nr:hypothetical protein EI77_03960 [Prosthecobacter fusiformis]